MSRESKIFTAESYEVQKTISIYEAFGWELLSINGKQISMTRETQNPVYTELVKHEALYEQKWEEYNAIRYPAAPQEPNPISFSTAAIAFLCLVFPGVLYVMYKNKEKKEYLSKYSRYTKEADDIHAYRKRLLAEIEQTVNDSRAIFFSRQK